MFVFRAVASILKNRFTRNKFVFRAVAGFLAGVKASHHSTDKENLDRLDLGVTQSSLICGSALQSLEKTFKEQSYLVMPCFSLDNQNI